MIDRTYFLKNTQYSLAEPFLLRTYSTLTSSNCEVNVIIRKYLKILFKGIKFIRAIDVGVDSLQKKNSF